MCLYFIPVASIEMGYYSTQFKKIAPELGEINWNRCLLLLAMSLLQFNGLFQFKTLIPGVSVMVKEREDNSVTTCPHS